MRNSVLIIVLLLGVFCACSSNSKDNIGNNSSSKDKDAKKDTERETMKVYKALDMEKSDYPDDLYVIMPDDITSSGYLKGANEEYRNEYMTDHDPFTWWTPYPERDGKEAWIELSFDSEVNIEGFEIWGGSHNPDYPEYGDIYKLNNRVKKGVCEFSDGSKLKFELVDVDNWQIIRFDEAIITSSIRLTIEEVYEGEKWNDLCIAEFLALTPDDENIYEGSGMAKPVIYLYPEEKTDVNVQINTEKMNGTLDITYPKYSATGWNVTAFPDGKLIDRSTNKTYNYLFWEGTSLKQWHFPDGFIVKGEDSADFLEEKLSYMGLLPNEYNDFIVYWLPLLSKNEYNLVRFVNEEYNRDVPLIITPQPESILRIYMVFEELKSPIIIPQQKLQKFERKGFTVVEWGGTQILKNNKDIAKVKFYDDNSIMIF